MNVRSVENLVKKYAHIVTPLKKITPHKLRSTYGTSLYRETGDIYLVADVLGHKDVNTTRKHYAAIDDDRRRSAAKYVKLRDATISKKNFFDDKMGWNRIRNFIFLKSKKLILQKKPKNVLYF